MSLRENADTDSLLDLAQGWRAVSQRFHREESSEMVPTDPGPMITAKQLEWAAREINRLRFENGKLHRAVSDFTNGA